MTTYPGIRGFCVFAVSKITEAQRNDRALDSAQDSIAKRVSRRTNYNGRAVK